MEYELDHVFIFTEAGAPAADQLVSSGLMEGTSNVHPGQGTCNRRFFFQNAMVELLWVHDADQAQNYTTSPTFLYLRWMNRNKGACPFGICLRPKIIHTNHYPFPGWAYRPQYLPQTFYIHVSDTANEIQQPFLFYLPYLNKQEFPPQGQPVEHSLGIHSVSHITVNMPDGIQPSRALQQLQKDGLLSIRSAKRYLLEVIFDNHDKATSLDFRPELPLIFHC
ncbi:MAG: hypothetical protein AMJ53_11825 [Gammaproteobacteria bacterium SG8_11]|nr:MAG: hypothetical protein AMJ53_11825 [Gammaproteobacteria bacterium SG8_11]